LFHEECRDEALQSGFRGKDHGDAGASFEFLVEAFVGALVGSGIEGVIALGFHGLVDQEAEAFGEGVLVVIQRSCKTVLITSV
jgi:hypothetical protein